MTLKDEALKMTVPVSQMKGSGSNYSRLKDHRPSLAQDLKAALKAKGLPVTGKKEDLVARLIAANPEPAAAEAPAAVLAPTEAAHVVVTTAPIAEAHKHAPLVFASTTDAVRVMITLHEGPCDTLCILPCGLAFPPSCHPPRFIMPEDGEEVGSHPPRGRACGYYGCPGRGQAY